MTVRFLSSASNELSEAVTYYEDQRLGLGYEFLSEVDTAIVKIMEFPNAWARLSNRARRILLRRFPYGLLYHARDEEIVVAAVMDLRRDPKNWREFL